MVQEAKALLDSLAEIAAPATALSIEEQDAELEKAEEALWGWYKEWSRIARIAVKRRVLLKQLGFLASPKSVDDTEDEVVPAPVPAIPPAPVTASAPRAASTTATA